MTVILDFTTLARDLDTIRATPDASRNAAMRSLVIAAGGSWLEPQGDATSHLVEISLDHVTGRGATVAEAIADWMRAAACALRHRHP